MKFYQTIVGEFLLIVFVLVFAVFACNVFVSIFDYSIFVIFMLSLLCFRAYIICIILDKIEEEAEVCCSVVDD